MPACGGGGGGGMPLVCGGGGGGMPNPGKVGPPAKSETVNFRLNCARRKCLYVRNMHVLQFDTANANCGKPQTNKKEDRVVHE